ncbi:MAG: EAL domain-containing protein [Lachnospiraceae bacterium]|nr:EAL domain-containing protein [Lachnospiraceae bacterium]
MKNKKYIKRSIQIVLFFTLLMCVGAAFYVKMLYDNYESELELTLSEVSYQSVATLTREMESRVRYVDSLAQMISKMDMEDTDSILEALGDLDFKDDSIVAKDVNYKNIGIIKNDGTAYTTNGEVYVAWNLKNFRFAMQNRSYISDAITDYDGDDVIMYTAPIDVDGKIVGALFMTFDVEIYRHIVNITSFDGEGYSYVVKNNGESVIPSNNPNSFQNFENIFGAMLNASDENEACVEDLMQKLKENEVDGYVIFHNKVNKYMYYRMVGYNDWYLLTVVPESVLNNKLYHTIRITSLILGIVVLVFAGLLSAITYIFYKSRKRIEEIAYVDPLTGGSTYDKFKVDVEELVVQNKSRKYAMITMDIDKFKLINDIFGYTEGNYIIKCIWEIIRRQIRSGEVFTHKRADEFMLFLKYDDIHEVIERIERIDAEVKRLKKNGNYEIELSVGICEVKPDGEFDINKEIDHAAITKGTVKGQHGKLYAIYNDNLRKKLLREKEIENRMEQAIRDREFVVFYQPKFSASTKELVGAEALVRWNAKDGMIYPNEFIPLFEKNGFITTLDQYVFETVCRDISRWRKEGLNVVPVSVNLSQLQLYNNNFLEIYANIIKNSEIPSSLVELELTETTFVSDSNILLDTISNLHALGINVLIDDFGTGYSSLNMLKSIPADVIKIDKSFVDDIGDERGNQIVTTIVHLGQSLDMKIVAEGVENEHQYEFLKSIYCDVIQGYYFSKPVSSDAFHEILIAKGIRR